MAEGGAIVARCRADCLAKAVAEMAGTGKPAQQCNVSQWQLTQAQQLAGPMQPAGQQVLVWRQAEAGAEHACEVILGEVATHGQLTEGDGLIQVCLDVFHQLPAQVRCQPAFEA
ncbi:hypothetical protein D3C79_945830 [compost metagenome]